MDRCAYLKFTKLLLGFYFDGIVIRCVSNFITIGVFHHLHIGGNVSSWKLQKLAFYIQDFIEHSLGPYLLTFGHSDKIETHVRDKEKSSVEIMYFEEIECKKLM